MSEERCETCRSCKYWDHECIGVDPSEGTDVSWCQRYPPVYTVEGWKNPQTYETDWCGEYRPDEPIAKTS